MARTPRPVNPDDGPIAAFAFDLRALRERAGSPTYRALAKTAGFSATTLGEAAGGVRLPTLEVALAYVGACGGDQEAWQERWNEVRALLDAAAGIGGDDAGSGEITIEVDQGNGDEVPDEPSAGSGDGDGADAGTADGSHGRLPLSPGTNTNAGVFAAEEEIPADSDDRTGAIAGSRPPFFGPRSVRRAFVLVGAICVLAAFAGLWAGQDLTAAHPSNAAAAGSASPSPGGCPAPDLRGVAFTGTTYGIGANVRSGASLSAVVRLRVPPGCTLGFSGYCLGDVVQDETAGTPDTRWFIAPDLGEVSSAIVHGNPPAGLAPSPCPDDVPAPASITLSVRPAAGSPGGVELEATGSQVWIVGFAAQYRKGGVGSAPAWHQLGLTGLGNGPAFQVLFQPPAHAAPGGGAGAIPIVAVACLGGDGPTGVVAVSALDPSDGQVAPTSVPSQSPSALVAAEQAACQYPGPSG